MEKQPFLFISAILFFMGMVFGGIAGYLYWQEANLKQAGGQAEGTVIGLSESSDEDGTAYAPVVTFRTGSGRAIEFKSTFYTSPASYQVGQKVTVLYDPEAPENAKIEGEDFLFILIFGSIGGLELLGGLFFLGKAIRAGVGVETVHAAH